MNLIEYMGDDKQKDEKNIMITKSSNTFQEHKFKLKNELGEPKDLEGAKAHLYIANNKNIVLEKEMTVHSSEGIVSFHFYENENIPAGKYVMEIKVTYDNGLHYEVFPSKSFIPVKVVEDLFSREDNPIIRTSLSVIIDRATKAVSEAKEQGDYAKEQGDYAKEQGEMAESVVENGAVVSVNGKIGIVSGLAEQSDLDETNSQLADFVEDIESDVDQFKTQTNSQLAEKASKIEVNELADKKADKSYVDDLFNNLDGLEIKGGYDTLNDLKSDYPNGAEGLYVVDSSLYAWNGNEWKSVKELEVAPWADFLTEQDEEWVI